MGKFSNKVLTFLNINRGRDLTLFLVSLVLAFFVWFIYNILLTSSIDAEVTIRAACNIEGHSAEAANNTIISAKCRSYGYAIIRRKIFSRKTPMTVNFSKLHPTQEGEFFYLTASEMHKYDQQIFGEKNTVESFVRDTFFFRFPYETCRKLPVVADYEFDYEPQYIMFGEMTLNPDSVMVYGEPAVINALDCVKTQPLKMSGISSRVSGDLRLEKINGVRLSEKSVEYFAEVVRYVELVRQFPVGTKHVPKDRRLMLYPSVVNVTFKCRFPGRNTVDSASFYVDYNDFLAARSGNCLIKADGITREVISYSMSPEVVECIPAAR